MDGRGLTPERDGQQPRSAGDVEPVEEVEPGEPVKPVDPEKPVDDGGWMPV